MQIPQIIPVNGKWNVRQDEHPHVSVSCFAVDHNGNFPVLWRSDKVRSAKNCWSIPSGLHEPGYTAPNQMCIELEEELGLKPMASTARFIGVYENIAACDSWHWVILIYAIGVESLDKIINKEPDKHSEIRIMSFDEALNLDPWAPYLKEAFVQNADIIRKAIDKLTVSCPF